jgi:hypothetical protein
MNSVPVAPEGKLWELLRRNSSFRKAVARLAQLDARARSEESGIDSRWTGYQMVERCESNPFAAVALQWLVPDPLFLYRKIVLPRDFQPTDRFVSPETIRLGRNRLPEDDDGENWQWFDSVGESTADSVANICGWPLYWGPKIERIVTAEPRLKHLCRDDIRKWREYFSQYTFDISTPWDKAPDHFRRAFGGYWSRMLGSHFKVYETDYFKGSNNWKRLSEAVTVVKAANRCIQNVVADLDRVKRGESETVCPPVPTKGGQTMRQVPQFAFSPNDNDLSQSIRFDDLGKKRIFVVPHVLRRRDAHRIVAEFQKHLVAQLPDDRELLGTDAFWKTAIAVEQIEVRLGIDTPAAIGAYIRQQWGALAVQKEFHGPREQLNRWFKKGVLLPEPANDQRRLRAEWQNVKTSVKAILRDVDRTYRSTVKIRVQFIRNLSAATFPRLNLDLLTALPPHKSKKSK